MLKGISPLNGLEFPRTQMPVTRIVEPRGICFMGMRRIVIAWLRTRGEEIGHRRTDHVLVLRGLPDFGDHFALDRDQIEYTFLLDASCFQLPVAGLAQACALLSQISPSVRVKKPLWTSGNPVASAPSLMRKSLCLSWLRSRGSWSRSAARRLAPARNR
jgi:hypothetical protein